MHSPRYVKLNTYRRNNNRVSNAIFAIIFIGVIALGLSIASLAVTLTRTVPSNNNSSNASIRAVPSYAIQVTSNVYYLGSHYAEHLRMNVEGYVILHTKKDLAYQNNNTIPDSTTSSSPSNDTVATTISSDGNYSSSLEGKRRSPPPLVSFSTDSCFGVYALGAKWRTTENYYVNANNVQGLGSAFVYTTVTNAINTWNNAIASYSNGFKPYGSRIATSIAPNTDSTNGKNEWGFGSIAESGVIAFTNVWGVFSGPEDSRQLFEWDQLYDQFDYPWGDGSADSNLMDLLQICVHEMGHASGLTDQYDASCSEQTMFGYATKGESKKRSLNSGDINGICTLYGSNSDACTAQSVGNNADYTKGRVNVLLIFTASIFVFILQKKK